MIARLRRRIPFDRPVILYMTATVILGATLFNGIYVVLFNLYLLRAGYGPEFIGVANAMGLFANGIFSLPAGMVAARWGLKRALIWGLGLAIVCHVLLPLFEFAPEPWRDGGVLIFRAVGYLGISLFSVNAIPLLMAITTPSERNVAFSVRTGLLPFSGFLGSLAGGVLPGLFAFLTGTPEELPGPYRWSLILASLLCFPAIRAVSAIDLEKSRQESSEEIDAADEPFPWSIFWIMLLVGVLRPAALGAVRTFFNVYLDEGLGLDTAQIGALFSVIWLVSAPVPLLMPAMAKRWGLKNTVIVATLGVAASATLMALVPNWIAASIGRFGVAGISSINFAALGVYMMALVRPRWRSTMSGVLNMSMGLGWAALSLGGGYIIAEFGFAPLFWIGVGITLVGILLFAWYFRVPRGELTDANMS